MLRYQESGARSQVKSRIFLQFFDFDLLTPDSSLLIPK